MWECEWNRWKESSLCLKSVPWHALDKCSYFSQVAAYITVGIESNVPFFGATEIPQPLFIKMWELFHLFLKVHVLIEAKLLCPGMVVKIRDDKTLLMCHETWSCYIFVIAGGWKSAITHVSQPFLGVKSPKHAWQTQLKQRPVSHAHTRTRTCTRRNLIRVFVNCGRQMLMVQATKQLCVWKMRIHKVIITSNINLIIPFYAIQ